MRIKTNKKGYMRVLEAIVAIVIVFGFVLTMMAKPATQTGKAPPELESTLNSILEEVQNNDAFRMCLLLNSTIILVKVENGGDVEIGTDIKCLKDHLDNALPKFSAWEYGFAICPGADTSGCDIYDINAASIPNGQTNKGIADMKFPEKKNIYTKSTVIAAPDVLAKPFKVKGCCAAPSPPTGPCELNEWLKTPSGSATVPACMPLDANNKIRGKTVIIYLWEKGK